MFYKKSTVLFTSHAILLSSANLFSSSMDENKFYYMT